MTKSFYIRRTNHTFTIPIVDEKGAVVYKRHPDTNAVIRVNGRMVSEEREERFSVLPGRRDDGEVWSIFTAEVGSQQEKYLSECVKDDASEILDQAGYELSLNEQAFKEKQKRIEFEKRAEKAENEAIEAKGLVEGLQKRVAELEGKKAKKAE